MLDADLPDRSGNKSRENFWRWIYERTHMSSLVYESIHNDDLTEVGRPVRATVYVEVNTKTQADREHRALLKRIEQSNEQEKRRN
jgi:hypothetical protein